MTRQIVSTMLSPKDRATIRQMALQGASTRTIARAVRREAATVRSWRKKLGVPEEDGVRTSRAWTEREMRELKRGWLACERQADIATGLGRTEFAVTRMAQFMKLPQRRRVWVEGVQRIVLVGADDKPKPPPKTKPRACLNCRREFASDGPGNRLCGRCNLGVQQGWIGQEPDPYNVVPVRRRAA